MSNILTPQYNKRLYPLYHHPVQQQLIDDTFNIPIRFCIIPPGRRCLEEGTMIATPSGPMPIEKLKVGDDVIGFNENGVPELTKIIKTWNNGIQEVVPLFNQRKKYLSATNNHKLFGCHESFLDKRGKGKETEYSKYKVRKVETIDRRINIKRKYLFDFINGGNINIENAYILGAILGGGCTSSDKTYVNKKNIKHIFFSTDNNIIPKYIANKLNGECRKNKGSNYTWTIRCKSPIYDLLPYYKEWCSGKVAGEKRANWNIIDNWNKKSCLSFLAGIIDTDSSIFYKSKTQLSINITMKSKEIIDTCSNIIFKYFQEYPNRHIDSRNMDIYGNYYSLSITNNLLFLNIYNRLLPYLKKKNYFDVKKLKIRNVLPHKITFRKGKTYKVETYDITVENKTNLYFLHKGGIITSNSGKSEIVGKRRLIARAIQGVDAINPRYFVAAPTRAQVKEIYWADLKIMSQPWQNPHRPPSESNLIIYLQGDREIHLIGMDRPSRIEGQHWDGGVLDEYGNMKKEVWANHVRPALSTPGRPAAWCDFVGVPEGRNHYYNLHEEARQIIKEKGEKSDWGIYHWISADILSAKEIEDAKRDLDDITYRQEYEGSFESHFGMVYYSFDEKIHCRRLDYYDYGDLHLCFDFNVSPGICIAIQEFELNGRTVDGIVGEVYIPKGSNTMRVTRKVLEMYGNHEGDVYLYGDATGGSKHSSQIGDRTDWVIIEDLLKPAFGNRLKNKVGRSNPRVKDRINSLNSRLLNSLGEVHLYVDPIKAKYTVRDFLNTSVLEGSAGEIDKSSKNSEYSHCTDGVGYCIYRRFPLKRGVRGVAKLLGF